MRSRSPDRRRQPADLLETLKLARLAERTDEIVQAVALVQRAERHRRCADLLENDRDGTLFAVKICDRERNTLAFCADTQDDELTGFAFFAMSGASISIRVTVGFSASFFRIVYITSQNLSFSFAFYPCGAFSNAESCKKRRNAYSITEKMQITMPNCQKVACGLLFQQIPAAAARQEEKLRRAAGISHQVIGSF